MLVAVSDLLRHRLIFVTGKGGVGKSTVATALGLVAVRRGRRTIVAELASQSRARAAFHESGATFEEVQLADGLFTISIDPELAMEEYLRVKTGSVGQALGSSRLFQALAMATPGMRELLSMGKVWELAQLQRRTSGADVYDLVIVDSPATGHGAGLLRTPQTFAEIARVGPIAHQARTIAATIADREFTAVAAVAIAEEMPVSETLWLRDALARDGMGLDAVIVNARLPERFAERDRAPLAQARDRARSPLVAAALDAALSEQARARGQAEQVRRLRDGLGQPVAQLPCLFTPQIGRPELELLADALELPRPERAAAAVGG
ncbi:MAG: ArsA family ATPase [Solirubrobacterales bacterium]|nr:ArsA family ATPase [Solirubrobacterales bacterium]